MNHLAFHGGSPRDVDALMEAAPSHGWRPLYPDRYPHAGGDAHYAGWLENAAGFKIEVVAQHERTGAGYVGLRPQPAGSLRRLRVGSVGAEGRSLPRLR